jgi:hypothetical protein
MVRPMRGKLLTPDDAAQNRALYDQARSRIRRAHALPPLPKWKRIRNRIYRADYNFTNHD